MIEIDYALLTKEALNNLIIDVITRQATDYGEKERSIAIKKAELLSKLEQGEAVIVYDLKEGFCDIVGVDKKVSKYNLFEEKP